MKAVIALALLLALLVLGYRYLGATGDEGSAAGTVATAEQPVAPDVDGATIDEQGVDVPRVPASQPASPRRIDYRCTLAGHLNLDGRPATGWRISVSGTNLEGSAEAFEWAFNKPQPVSWVANDLGGGHARARFARDMVLVPGLNSLDVDLEVGSLELQGFPLPAEFDIGGTADISIDLALTWRRLDGLRWMATLFTAEDGSLVLENVPAGKVQLRRVLPGDRVKSLEEARVILEIDVPAGERTLLRFPD